MLQEQRIGADGVYTFDKVQVAIDRLRAFEALALEYSPEGYYLCDSGGKDSSVIKELAIMAGVKHGVHHNHTTLDHPETVYFVRREKARCEAMGIPYTIHYPKMSFPQLMRKKKMPPTRLKRYCCEVLKEPGGRDRVCVTGVRWSESVKRSHQRGTLEVLTPRYKDKLILANDNDESRKEFETCQIKGKRVLGGMGQVAKFRCTSIPPRLRRSTTRSWAKTMEVKQNHEIQLIHSHHQKGGAGIFPR